MQNERYLNSEIPSEIIELVSKVRKEQFDSLSLFRNPATELKGFLLRLYPAELSEIASKYHFSADQMDKFLNIQASKVFEGWGEKEESFRQRLNEGTTMNAWQGEKAAQFEAVAEKGFPNWDNFIQSVLRSGAVAGQDAETLRRFLIIDTMNQPGEGRISLQERIGVDESDLRRGTRAFEKLMEFVRREQHRVS